MTTDRVSGLLKMLERSPNDPRVHFGLALEYEKAGQWEDVCSRLSRYLELTEDEGNAWGRLGHALRQLGRVDQARAAYARGIEVSSRHGHPSMALEFEEILEDLD